MPSIHPIPDMPSSSNATNGHRREFGVVTDGNGHHHDHHLPPLLLQSLKEKLARGDELSPKDLRSLRPLHNITGRHRGDGNQYDPIDYLDRQFLHQPPSLTSGPQLVRYVGMVQDMLDPEYYPSLVDGKSAHFRDWNPFDSAPPGQEENGPDEGGTFSPDAEGCTLAERVPLVIVPIPFASQWLLRGGASPCGTTEAASVSATTTPTNLDAQRRTDGPTSVGAVMVPPTPQPQAENRKRGRGGDEEETWRDDEPSHSPEGRHPRCLHSSTHRPMDVDDENGKVGTTSGDDWWPAGTCGTSVEDCPVLAKLCYDQLFRSDDDEPMSSGTSCATTSSISATGYDGTKDKTEHWRRQHPSPHSQERQRLRLNDLVSLVGVLSINPWEVDFAAQRPRDDEEVGCCWEEFEVGLSSFAPRPPPPSRLPRLHVLSYQRLDLDELAAQAVAGQSYHNHQKPPTTEHTDGHVMSVVDDDDAEASVTAPPPLQPLFSTPLALTHQLLAGWDPIVTQAIWMTLLSRGEWRRDPSTAGPESVEEGAGESRTRSSLLRVGPSERALGCLSLQISTPDLATSRSCFDYLATTVLPALCPVVATVECDDHRCIISGGHSDDNINVVASPAKDKNGRMTPCPLQLPAGSVVLVHYHPTGPIRISGCNSSTAVDDGRHMAVKPMLHELVQHHRLPYTFEGDVTIPFEADYRVIIVTTQTQRLPCSWTVLTHKGTGQWRRTAGQASHGGSISDGNNPHEGDHHLRGPSPSAVAALQEALCHARSARGNPCVGTNGNIKLAPSLLEQAQQDFLERRRHHTDVGDYGGAMGRSLPGEDDFHRWLNLAKLQSMSRCTIRRLSSQDDPLDMEELEATVEDWQDALQLDDIIRGME